MILIAFILFANRTSHAQGWHAQGWRIGIGLSVSETYATNNRNRGVLIINDSVFIFARSQRSGFKTLKEDDNKRLILYIERIFLEKENYNLSMGLSYQKRYSQLQLGYIGYTKKGKGIPLVGIIPVSNPSFLLKMSGSFMPFKKLFFSLGSSIGVHLKQKVVSGNFLPNSILSDSYEEIQNLHRRITFNYHLKSGYYLSKKLGFLLFYSQSISQVNKSVKINKKTYELPLKWQNLGIMLTYKL